VEHSDQEYILSPERKGYEGVGGPLNRWWMHVMGWRVFDRVPVVTIQ